MFLFRFAIETIRYRSFIIEELVLSLTSLVLRLAEQRNHFLPKEQIRVLITMLHAGLGSRGNRFFMIMNNHA